MNSFLIKYHFLYYSSFFSKSQVIEKNIISLFGSLTVDIEKKPYGAYKMALFCQIFLFFMCSLFYN